MDKLSMAIIAMEAHVACSNDRLRQAWDIIHAKLVEENGSSHNSAMDAIKAVCERTDPHETDVEVLRVTINKIYAALTMHHGADVVRNWPKI